MPLSCISIPNWFIYLVTLCIYGFPSVVNDMDKNDIMIYGKHVKLFFIFFLQCKLVLNMHWLHGPCNILAVLCLQWFVLQLLGGKQFTFLGQPTKFTTVCLLLFTSLLVYGIWKFSLYIVYFPNIQYPITYNSWLFISQEIIQILEFWTWVSILFH